MVNLFLQGRAWQCQSEPMTPAAASLLLLLLAATAAEAAVPLPRLRPGDLFIQDTGSAIPLPRLRPSRDASAAPSQGGNDVAEPPGDVPKSKRSSPIAWPAGKGSWPASALDEAREACRGLLAGRDIDFTPLPAIGGAGGCGSAAPIEVTRIGAVALKPSATISCPLAAELDDWLKTTVQPAAKARLGTQVTEIHVAASYVCRRRNNSSTGKLSEHGKANALDMSGFSFAAQKEVTVAGGGGWGSGLLGKIGLSKGGSFLGDIRKGACSYFTTVLGPGSDPYHGDHFHVDVLQRRGGYRICK